MSREGLREQQQQQHTDNFDRFTEGLALPRRMSPVGAGLLAALLTQQELGGQQNDDTLLVARILFWEPPEEIPGYSTGSGSDLSPPMATITRRLTPPFDNNNSSSTGTFFVSPKPFRFTLEGFGDG